MNLRSPTLKMVTEMKSPMDTADEKMDCDEITASTSSCDVIEVASVSNTTVPKSTLPW